MVQTPHSPLQFIKSSASAPAAITSSTAFDLSKLSEEIVKSDKRRKDGYAISQEIHYSVLKASNAMECEGISKEEKQNQIKRLEALVLGVLVSQETSKIEKRRTILIAVINYFPPKMRTSVSFLWEANLSQRIKE